MLFKNDQKYDLTAADYKAMAEFIGCSYEGTSFRNFPLGGVIVKYPPTAYTPDPDKKRRPDKPMMIPIEYEQEIMTNAGTEKWNYCKRPPTIKPGESPKYEGDTVRFMTHQFSIKENEPDLLYFLICISRRGYHVPGVSKAAYEIENKAKESAKRNNDRATKIQVEAAILHPTERMHIDDVIRVGMAMKIPNLAGLTEDEQRDALIRKIEAMEQSSEKNGYKMFLELTDSGAAAPRVEMLAIIQKLKDAKLIEFKSMSNKWYSMKEGKQKSVICALVAGKTADESIEHAAMQDTEVGEGLMRMSLDMDVKKTDDTSAEIKKTPGKLM